MDDVLFSIALDAISKRCRYNMLISDRYLLHYLLSLAASVA